MQEADQSEEISIFSNLAVFFSLISALKIPVGKWRPRKFTAPGLSESMQKGRRASQASCSMHVRVLGTLVPAAIRGWYACCDSELMTIRSPKRSPQLDTGVEEDFPNQMNQDSPNIKHAVLLFGPPGSGKGTMGLALGTLPGCTFVSMGETLRSVDPETDSGRRIREIQRKGDFVPADLVISVWIQRMKKLARQGFRPDQDLLALDGLPRTRQQAELLGSHLHIQQVIHLACDDRSLLEQRIRNRDAGREDDTDASVIRHRFDVYEEQTEPLLQWYPEEKISTVDAALPPMEVLGGIIGALTNCKNTPAKKRAIQNQT